MVRRYFWQVMLRGALLGRIFWWIYVSRPSFFFFFLLLLWVRGVVERCGLTMWLKGGYAV